MLFYKNFKELAVKTTQVFTPKCEENVDKAIEFELEIKGETFLLRAFAPSNYRRVIAKFPKRIFEEFNNKNFYKDRIIGEWVEIANHDSCWDNGFDLHKYSGYSEESIMLKKITYGELPKSYKIGEEVMVDIHKGEHLKPFVKAKVIDLEDCSNKFEVYERVLKQLYCVGDEMVVLFERKGEGKDKSIEIVNEATIQNYRRRGVKGNPRKALFTAEGLQKLLGKGEWSLWSIRHYRPNAKTAFR